MGSFVLSQSALKDSERIDCCMYKWRGRWITREIQFPSSIYMDRGSYFEYKCLGSGAYEDVTELPLKKNGERYADSIRIDMQVARFNELFDKHNFDYIGLQIKDIQKSLFSEFKGFKERGIIDAEVIDDWSGKTSLLDLKLSANVDSKFTHNPFNADDIDITQATWYSNMYERLHNYRPDFIYLVFDYSKDLNVRRLDISVSDTDILLLNERKDSLIEKINSDFYEKAPSKKECSVCTLQCEARFSEISP